MKEGGILKNGLGSNAQEEIRD